jgi:hypothetical protein
MAPAGPVRVIATDAALTGSLKVAETAVAVETPPAPGAGACAITVGGVVSTAAVSKTTSTQ